MSPATLRWIERRRNAIAVAAALAAAGLLLTVLFAVSRASAGDTPVERRARVESLDAAAKDELRRKQERFAAMEPAEQERLRRLHRELEADPQSPRLREVMDHYYQWLLTLPSYCRAELLQLGPQERVKRIRTLLDEQAKNDVKKLSPADVECLWRWIDRYAAEHESQIQEKLVLPENVRQQMAQLPTAARQRVMFALLWRQLQNQGGAKGTLLSEQDLASLRGDLSPELRKRLENRPALEQRNQMLNWMRQTVQKHLTAGGAKFMLPMANDDQLAKFFEHDLPPEQRERLLNLPEEDMLRELRQLYAISSRQAEGGRLGERPGRGKKPDPNHPGKGKKHLRDIPGLKPTTSAKSGDLVE